MAAARAQSAVFLWQGKDRQGKAVKGEMSSANSAQVRVALRRQGIAPLSIRKKSNLFKSEGKVTPKDIAIFSRQLATMIAAGLPLVQALEIIGRGHEIPAMQTLLLRVKADVEGGGTLASALKAHPEHFDDLYVNLINAGEQAGILETLLHKIATYKEKTEALKAKVKKAMIYPAAVIVVAIVVTSILLIFVVPQFEDLFADFGAELPAFTQFVIGISQWPQSNLYILLAILIGAAVAFFQARKRRGFNRFLDIAILKLPIIGVLLHKSAIARFSRTLSTMFAAGTPIVEAMVSVAGASGNAIFEEACMKMRDELATGTQLQVAMEQSGLFPNMVVQMVAIGEEAGSLDAMLSKVADFYEAEVDDLVDSLSSLMEPIIMVILAILVGGLIVAMYLPIFKLGQVV